MDYETAVRVELVDCETAVRVELVALSGVMHAHSRGWVKDSLTTACKKSLGTDLEVVGDSRAALTHHPLSRACFLLLLSTRISRYVRNMSLKNSLLCL